MPWFYIAVALVLAGAAWVIVNTRIPLPQQIRTVVNIVVVLIFVGVLLWLINMYVPMAPVIKGILNIVVVVATCVFILQAVGLWGNVVGLWNSAIHRAGRGMDENARKNG
jgi:Na+-translocating ferredoxin:NAD+ oxidoreductase RnfE subunit